jgi:Tol biopolymer transport system component
MRNGESHVLAAISVDTLERRPMTFAPPAGSAERRVGDSGPAFSPDGRVLAFHRIFAAGISDIFLQDLGEDLSPLGEPRRLTFENRLALNPGWWPDGRAVIFTAGPYSTGRYLAKIVVPRATGTPPLPERLTAGEDAQSVAISPNGAVVYARNTVDSNLWRAELSRTDGAGASRIVASTRVEMQGRFSPDGRRLVFASERSGQYQIWISEADGNNQRQLTTLNGLAVNARWSPDGASIVFDARVKEDTDIYVVRVEGGEARKLTTTQSTDHLPSFSHDGRWIYFASDRSGRSEIWRLPSPGGDAIQVTRQGGHTAIQSPAGDLLVYSKVGPAGISLWWAPSAGGDETQVAEAITATADFVVARDGVYFTVSGAGVRTLQFAAFRSRTPRAVRTIPGTAQSFDVSSDGRWIVWEQSING